LKKTKQITGKFIGNERGFGFVQHEGGEDIFIPPHAVFGALHGDEVLCKTEEKEQEAGNRVAGKILEIIRRAPMVGTFFADGKQGFVRSTEKKIPYPFAVPPKTIARFGLADGHRVIFSVDKKNKHDEGLTACFITEVLGHINDPGVDVLTLVRQANVPCEFPEDVLEEIKKIPSEIMPHEFENRRDLRGEFIFTIDGDDTKDIDDAISFAKTDDGFLLGVHIADVTHYVREGSAIDASALCRGTSIYLADRVIPMLPHTLSSGICSLFADVDRLSLSCIMTVDANGNVTDYEITPSIIRSKKRFTYTEAQSILDDGDNELINSMDELREILREKRQKRGALDFDLPEAKIRVDENGRVISIEPYPRNNATGIIEEFMILCNETIATHFLSRKIPFVYRTHDAPSAEKMKGLQNLLLNHGLGRKKLTPTSETLQRIIAAAKKSPASYAISTAILQTLPQAAYTSSSPMHFGLASDAYCHFTSPIRRYADLQIHRIIKEEASLSPEDLSAVCAQCSRTERVAENLEREVAELKKVQFMANKEGQAFDAIVSGLTSWGVYIMLNNTVEGMIPTANLLKHRYKFNKEQNLYETKRRKGEKAKILLHGSPVRVRLVQANEEERKLTFVLQ
jgi:ribonuclease R